MRTTILFRGLLAMGAALAALLFTGLAAAAQDPREATQLLIAAPQETDLGNTVRVLVRLEDSAGSPIPDAAVQFSTPSSFAGAVAEMDIGQRRTDSEGLAHLDYQLRVEGQNQFTARFLGNDTHQPAEAAAQVAAIGSVQLSQRTAGVEFPVRGTWALLAVILGVWSVYFIVMFLVSRIPETTAPRA